MAANREAVIVGVADAALRDGMLAQPMTPLQVQAKVAAAAGARPPGHGSYRRRTRYSFLRIHSQRSSARLLTSRQPRMQYVSLSALRGRSRGTVS